MASAQTEKKLNLKKVEATFLTSYYEQDGNHSPVTGGVGTEKLENFAPSIILKIPLDTHKTLSINGGVDFYSSASSDNINNPTRNRFQVSSASAKDERSYVTIGLKRKNSVKKTEHGSYFGLSSEFDVQSASLGKSFAKLSKNENQSFYAKATYYFDYWKLFYPIELRNGTVNYLNTNVRQSLNFSMVGTTVINKRMNFGLTADLVVQSGLLSTPFHRVYFQNSERAVVEQLPSLRIKYPVAARLNYHVTDFMILKSFYRFYQDSWGVKGHTFNLEMPIKVSHAFRLYPFVRYHEQTAANYFGAYQTFTGLEEFYTSDYDLSELQSFKKGIGLRYAPLYGVFGKNNNGEAGVLKKLDIRYANYNRNDGFTANVISLGLTFKGN